MPPYIEEKMKEFDEHFTVNGKYWHLVNGDVKNVRRFIEDSLISLHNHTLEEVKKCVPEEIDWMDWGSEEAYGHNRCRQETLEAIEKLKQ